MKVQNVVPLGPGVVYAPPAFKGQSKAKGATRARFDAVAARLAAAQTVEEEFDPACRSFPETVRYVVRGLEYAPPAPGPIARGLLGWWTKDGAYICATCAGRLIARGVSLPAGMESVWEEPPSPWGVCCGCGK